jgi:protease-4
VFMQGSMGMNGDMAMNGSMDMRGDLGVDGTIVTSLKTDNRASRLSRVVVRPGSASAGSIAVIDIDGLLLNRNLGGLGSMGENPVALFREKLDTVEADPSVGGVVLRINSPGGGVTASDIMARDLRAFRLRRGIPVVACLMDVGAGGGYLLASTADLVVAHPTTLVGGLGVILNSYNLEETMAQFNVIARPVKSGNKIDAASPVRPLEPDELAMLEGLASRFHDRLRRQIQEARSRLVDNDKLFDGRVMTGEEAVAVGLVDRIGYLDDALAEAGRMADGNGLPEVVMLRRDNDRAHTPLDVTPNLPLHASLLPVNVPGLDRSQLPTFLYCWQPETSLTAHAGG